LTSCRRPLRDISTHVQVRQLFSSLISSVNFLASSGHSSAMASELINPNPQVYAVAELHRSPLSDDDSAVEAFDAIEVFGKNQNSFTIFTWYIDMPTRAYSEDK
jgi:hypothetical protein